MASRSIEITINNITGQTLTFQSVVFEHGGLGPGQQVPATIANTATVTFEVESNGTGTGVQGTIVYQIGDVQSQTVALNFDNPFVGSNEFSAVTNPPTSFNCAVLPINGNNAFVTYTVSAG